MDISKFNLLSIEEKIHYINNRLANGETVIRIRQDLNIGEKSLQKIIKEAGYKYNQKLKRYDKDSTDVIPYNLRDDLIEIIQMKDDLREIINNYKNVYDKEHTPQVIEIVEDKGIKISLPDAKIVRSTFRVNEEVLANWNSFCNENKEFSKTNLLSSALNEYIEKYSNKK